MTDRTDGDRSDDESDASSVPGPTDSPSASEGLLAPIRWLWTTDSVSVIYLRDILTSVAIVLVIGVLLFAASGVWPPMVAVESGSMEPNMERGDLVFIVDSGRFVPDEAVSTGGVSTGVVPADVAERHGQTEFGGYGDVIVFRPNGNAGHVPIIHRAMLFVDEGENWYDRADPAAVGSADNCEELSHCPAPHAGFITKGDNERTNENYDQASRLSAPVRPGWIVGIAELRIPYLGHVRLLFSSVTVTPLEAVNTAPPELTVEVPDKEPTEPARASSRPA